MIEIYTDIKPEVKQTAEMIWKLALTKKDAFQTADYLNTMIKYYESIYNEEEIEFLQFYFKTQMEMMKE